MQDYKGDLEDNTILIIIPAIPNLASWNYNFFYRIVEFFLILALFFPMDIPTN